MRCGSKVKYFLLRISLTFLFLRAIVNISIQTLMNRSNRLISAIWRSKILPIIDGAKLELLEELFGLHSLL